MKKEVIKKIIGWVLILIGIASIISATIIQTNLLCEYSKVTMGRTLYVSHWSLWLYLGIIPFLIGFFLISKEVNNGEDDRK